MEKSTPNTSARLAGAVRSAFGPALRTAWWLVRLTVPISLAMAVLSHIGVVEWISAQLSPLFSVAGLDGRGALVWITAVLGHLYAAIAVMFTVGIELRDAVILAVMCLVSHNLIIETAIQKRTGASGAGMVALRIGVSFLAGTLLNLILPADMTGALHGAETGAPVSATWGGMLAKWGLTLLPLLGRMAAIILGLNILQSVLREFGILNLIAWPLRPVMWLFGLPRSTSFLWIICNVVGLTYGGAALVDELQRGKATPADARLLNTHVAISHSLLEDTLIFWTVGVPLLWLLVPRVLLAVTAVWVQRIARTVWKPGREVTPVAQ